MIDSNPGQAPLSATVITMTGNETDAELKESAWEMFCTGHPHEAYEQDTDGFWKYFHTIQPTVTRKQMIALLKETGEQTP